MSEFKDTVLTWLAANLGKLIWLVVVIALAIAASTVFGRLLRRVLDKSQIPSASIFVNLMRAIICLLAFALVLEPVFGINPTTLLAALGIGGLALSLGLKDTIANVIGGFALMFGHVIRPGDLVTIQDITGTVRDITWRQTVIETRLGNHMVIPNSVLNTTALTRLTPATESAVTVAFTARGDSAPEQLERDILAAVSGATADLTMPGSQPVVRLTGFSPYGTEGNVVLFARDGVALPTVADQAARAIAEMSDNHLVTNGASSAQ
ncbi:mechanosensitive ion channel family protein [Bifidobacterium panos]|uniref:Transporter n=1 Tax=Bifidobacterium panos TaxID=2675321 RepID=A0ABX1SZN1_9BIFI|nr:mechanosensitive ion channel domain-containing protein [Bifidobacterium sp. DSM 109963]NMN02637.1 transporter [Bifidobacterium sp. DSM 109963]